MTATEPIAFAPAMRPATAASWMPRQRTRSRRKISGGRAQQGWRVFGRGVHHSCLRRGLGRHLRRRVRCLLCRFGGKADKSAGGGEVAVFRTHAFRFESQQTSGCGTELAADGSSRRAAKKSSQRAARNWERLLCKRFEDSTQRSTGRQVEHLADSARGL